jgi:hypothetical protein
MAVTANIAVFCDVTPCGLSEVFRSGSATSFGIPCGFGRRLPDYTASLPIRQKSSHNDISLLHFCHLLAYCSTPSFSLRLHGTTD